MRDYLKDGQCVEKGLYIGTLDWTADSIDSTAQKRGFQNLATKMATHDYG